MMNSLVTENMDLKGRIQAVERKLSDMEKHISKLKEALDEL
jgi:hypothetical protein